MKIVIAGCIVALLFVLFLGAIISVLLNPRYQCPECGAYFDSDLCRNCWYLPERITDDEIDELHTQAVGS